MTKLWDSQNPDRVREFKKNAERKRVGGLKNAPQICPRCGRGIGVSRSGHGFSAHKDTIGFWCGRGIST